MISVLKQQITDRVGRPNFRAIDCYKAAGDIEAHIEEHLRDIERACRKGDKLPLSCDRALHGPGRARGRSLALGAEPPACILPRFSRHPTK
jgi:hypothetical protein